MYGFWVLILFLENRKQFSNIEIRYYISASIIFILFGGIMEILQELVIPGRFGAWSDFTANAVGCMLGLGLIFLASQRNQKHI